MNATTQPPVPEDTLLRRRTVFVLQAGFRIAVVLVALGVLLAVARQEALPHELGNPIELVEGAVEGDPGSVVGLGIVAVILTPLAATIAITATFLQLGDRRHATVAGVIVLILLVSISLSVV